MEIPMMKVNTVGKHDFYYAKGNKRGVHLFNIVESGSAAPLSGYYKAEYILHVKGFSPNDKSFFDPNFKVSP